jgi:hypothetical protein
VFWVTSGIDIGERRCRNRVGRDWRVSRIGLEESLLLLALVVSSAILPCSASVVPFAGLLSLYKSWLRAKAENIRSARLTTFWMLVSQLAGGVLTILIIPLLRLIAPSGPLGDHRGRRCSSASVCSCRSPSRPRGLEFRLLETNRGPINAMPPMHTDETKPQMNTDEHR